MHLKQQRPSRTVVPLRASDLTPAMVLETVQEDLPILQDVYICGIDVSGAPVMYASGDLRNLPLAILAMQNLALALLNGDISDS